jgi:hypothetical protein
MVLLKSGFDTLDADRRKGLTMTLFATIPFSAFVFENNNLLAFALGHDLAVNRYAVYGGLTDLDILAVGKYKDIVESDFGTDVSGKLFHP